MSGTDFRSKQGGESVSWLCTGSHRDPSRAGFTLVEALIAGLIAALAMGAIATSLIMHRRSATMARRQLEALHRARSVLESVTQNHFYAAPLNVGRHAVGDGHYDVSNVDGRTKNIVVRMPWINPNGRTNWVELTTSFSSSLHY